MPLLHSPIRGVLALMAGLLAADAALASTVQTTDKITFPARESWQPPIDPALPSFKNCPALPRKPPIEGSAPAILPDLVGRWTREFARLCHEDVLVPPPYGPPLATGSPRLHSFIEDKLDFAFLTRDMSETDLQLYRRIHRRDPLVVPVAGGSFRHFGFVDTIVVIVNAKNPVDRISLRQLGAIFFAPGAGRTAPRYWSEIDRRGGGRPIHVVGAAAWRPIESARASFVHRRISQIEGRELTWRMDLPAAGREADIPAQVAADRDAIGFTGLGHLLPADKVLAISRSDGALAIPPSYENVAARRYSLARTIDLVAKVPASGRINPGLCSFAQFLLSRQGQQIVRDEGVFLPLSHVQVSRSRSFITRYCAT